VGKTCQIDRLSFAAGRAAIKDFERRGISIPGLDDYLKQERPINKQAADEYIATLQRDEQQSTL
jgi:hypothetical protein